MNNQELFQEIKKFSDCGKLSVFVGAGVSRLSDYPSWSSLVRKMADDLKYKYDINKKGEVVFSSEELLKIPQMFYVNRGKEKYNEIISQSFSNDCEPNDIHDLILSLNPNHILTTNYDTLLEETAVKFGKNFSIINSDKVVSKTETVNYIVKVHGDFSGGFVLKEQDYLDYEYNYKLIDNIVKTIFATNLVLFIGYGLNDYNIKLILNWVKNVQLDTFTNPIFIHTDDKINEEEMSYQINRGLRILDCNNYTDSEDYHEKYRSVLLKVLSCNDISNLKDKKQVLQYMYEKIIGIKNLSYIRRKDFNKIFNGEYELNDQWKIVNKTVIRKLDNDLKEVKSYRLNYFEDYYASKDEYKNINQAQFDVIEDFLQRNNIVGIDNDYKFNFSNIKIGTFAFLNKYSDMKTFILNDYTDIYDNYKKAYYLAQLGEYAHSYNLYTAILGKAKQEEQWDLYYFSQINRSYLFSIIKQMDSFTKGFNGVTNFGKELYLFENKFLKKMKNEMNNHILKEQFNELPYNFKNNNVFLNSFSQRNCYTKEYIELLKEKYEVDKDCSKNIISFGLSKFDKVKLDMMDTVKFIYDNMLLFSGFDENKIYVKNALVAWIEAYMNDLNVNITSNFKSFSNSRYKFTFIDICLISKCFKKDDIEYLESIVDLEEVPFEENNRLEQYITDNMVMYSTLFNGTLKGGQIFLWKLFSEELKILLIISPYFIKSQECVSNVIKFIIEVKDGHFDVQDRLSILDKWIWIAKAEQPEIKLEEWLIDKFNEISITKLPTEIERIQSDIEGISKVMSNIAYNTNVTFNLVSDFIEESDKMIVEKIVSYIEPLYPYINKNVQQRLHDFYEVKDVFQLIHRYENGNIPDKCDKVAIIKTYLSEKCSQIKKNNLNEKVKRYSLTSGGELLSVVAGFILSYDFSDKINIEDFGGICSEYDFLLLPEKFEENQFELSWLFNYSDILLEKIKKNKRQKEISIKAIEESFGDNSMNKKQMKKLFYIYKELQ